MRLLILTQKVDREDPILGFFHAWIEEFAKKFEKVHVICLEKGNYGLPPNVEVLSLGKEDGESKIKYIFNLFKYLFRLNGEYDAVFVHMNQEYLVLAGWWWKLMGKKTVLWYVHRQVNIKLRIAEFFVDNIFSVSKETFNLKSNKVHFVGHGIPLEIFKKPETYQRRDDKFSIVSIGRISPIKNLEILIESADILHKNIPNLQINIIGGPTKKGDQEYFDKLRAMVKEMHLEHVVEFWGETPNYNTIQCYWQSDISVNLSPTGGVDKAVLESIASGTPALASNKAFEEYFGKYKEDLMFKERDAQDLAQKIIKFKDRRDKDAVINFLLDRVKEKSDLKYLISKITQEIQ
jgi:glycosyltransferase involved in cell wall biosynthesis